MFSIGEKVVCIENYDVRKEYYPLGERYPVKGNMYTIRTINLEDDRCWLRFEELINPPIHYSTGLGEGQFNSEAFRKLDHSFAEEVLANIKEEVLTEKCY